MNLLTRRAIIAAISPKKRLARILLKVSLMDEFMWTAASWNNVFSEAAIAQDVYDNPASTTSDYKEAYADVKDALASLVRWNPDMALAGVTNSFWADLTTTALFQDASGTVPADNGDVIGYITNQSAHGTWELSQGTSGQKALKNPDGMVFPSYGRYEVPGMWRYLDKTFGVSIIPAAETQGNSQYYGVIGSGRTASGTQTPAPEITLMTSTPASSGTGDTRLGWHNPYSTEFRFVSSPVVAGQLIAAVVAAGPRSGSSSSVKFLSGSVYNSGSYNLGSNATPNSYLEVGACKNRSSATVGRVSAIKKIFVAEMFIDEDGARRLHSWLMN